MNCCPAVAYAHEVVFAEAMWGCSCYRGWRYRQAQLRNPARHNMLKGGPAICSLSNKTRLPMDYYGRIPISTILWRQVP